jgi:hypothetical protein
MNVWLVPLSLDLQTVDAKLILVIVPAFNSMMALVSHVTQVIFPQMTTNLARNLCAPQAKAWKEVNASDVHSTPH